MAFLSYENADSESGRGLPRVILRARKNQTETLLTQLIIQLFLTMHLLLISYSKSLILAATETFLDSSLKEYSKNVSCRFSNKEGIEGGTAWALAVLYAWKILDIHVAHLLRTFRFLLHVTNSESPSLDNLFKIGSIRKCICESTEFSFWGP